MFTLAIRYFFNYPLITFTQVVNNFYIPNIYFIHLIYISDLPLTELRTFQLGLRIFIFTRIYPDGKLWEIKKKKGPLFESIFPNPI